MITLIREFIANRLEPDRIAMRNALKYYVANGCIMLNNLTPRDYKITSMEEMRELKRQAGTIDPEFY